MSAQELRAAAALMRSRAVAATPGPWIAEYSKVSGHCVIDAESTNCLDSVARCTHYRDGLDSHHIASWHPTVALAVADWIDGHARDLEVSGRLSSCDSPGDVESALVVARAYTGGAS